MNNSNRSTFRAEVLESRRLFAAGGVDATFNLTGKTSVGFGQQFDSAATVLRQSDGKLVIAGFTSSNSTGASSFALTRLNADGTVDTTFGSAGRTTTSFPNNGSAQVVGAGLLSDGKIILGGYVTTGGSTDFALARYDANGVLDTTYGSQGFAVTDLGSTSEIASAFLLGANDTVYLAGSNGAAVSSFIVARFTAAGTLDTTWDADGIAAVNLPGGGGTVQSLALVPNTGAVVAAGFQSTPTATAGVTQSDFAVARFTAAGAPDATFNTSGVFVTDFAGQAAPDEALGVTVQPDGKIIAAGFSGNTLPKNGTSRFAVLRLNTNGTLDTSFANGGKFVSAPTVPTYQSLSAVTLLPDGRILAAGSVGDPNAPGASQDAINTDFAVIRLSTTGVLDTTYGTNGIATSDITGGFDDARSLVVLPDERVVVAGFAGNSSQQGGGADFAATRLVSDTAGTTVLLASVFAPGPVVQGSLAVFTVSLSQPATTPVTVNFTTADGTALAGTDYTAVAGTLTFNPGEQTKPLAIATLASPGNTAGRTLSLTLTPGTGTSVETATASTTILGTAQQAPLPVISIADITVAEPGDGADTSDAVFTVTLDRTSTSPVTVNFATGSGSALQGVDFTPITGTLTFAPGETSKTVTVKVLGDANTTPVEGNEAFVVNLTSPTNAVLSGTNQAIATVTNTPRATPPTPPAAVTLSVGDAALTERLSNRSTLSFPVTLSAASTAPVTLTFSTADGTATAGTDYTAVTNGTVTIPAGATTGTITVTVLGDITVEQAESFTVTVSAATGATLADATGTGTINDALFRTVTFAGKTKAVYTDSDGQKVTVSISGPGTGTLVFPTAPANVDADSLYLDGTTTKSKVTLTPSGRNAATSLQFIRLNAPVSSISGKLVDLGGDLNGTGSISTLTLRNVASAGLTFAAGATPTLSLATVTDSSIASASPIKSLTVKAWNDSGADDALSAPDFPRITASTGNFSPKITATAGGVGTLSVKGTLLGGATVTGTLKSVTAAAITNAVLDAGVDVSKVSVKGAITNTVVRAGRRLVSLTAGSLANSTLLAGVAASTTTLPSTPSAFTGSVGSSIGRITVKSFSDSLVIAPTIDSVTLGTIPAGSKPFGVAADTIKTASYQVAGAKKTTVKNPQTTITSGNFSIVPL